MENDTVVEGARTWVIAAPEWLSHETRILSWVVSAEQSLAWHYGKLLTGFTLKRREREWMLVVHVIAVDGYGDNDPEVCFTYGPTMFDALENFALDLKRGQIRWKEDKYPPFARSDG